MLKKKKAILLILVLFIFLLGMTTETQTGIDNTKLIDENKVLGFGFLKRIPGLWSGPVETSTPAGNFDNWYVDFRPISSSQVAQFTSIDKDTINYLSFFIVKHDGKLKLAMRTEGVFQNKGCVTYEVMDKAVEGKGYYRFSDFCSGTGRAYTEFRFKKNKFVMEAYTNKFNKLQKLELHSRWKAKLGDKKAAESAMKDLGYPKPIAVKDFSGVFHNMSESIYYSFENDPYSFSELPYVGTVTVNINIDEKLKIKDTDEIFLLLTTESLFDGIKYKKENLKYISRHIYLPVNIRTYTVKNVHPGKFFIYSYIDINGDKRHLTGDYFSSNINHSFDVEKEGNIIIDTLIDYVIP